MIIIKKMKDLEVKMEVLPRFHPPPRQFSEAQTDRHVIRKC